MQLALSDDQMMIRESAASFLADASDSAAVRRIMESEAGFDEVQWAAMARELGWSGVAIDEAHGGLGLGAAELVLIQEQAGHRLLCSPFFSTVCMAATLLAEAGHAAAQDELLPKLAAGELRVASMLDVQADDRPAVMPTAHRDGAGWWLDGHVPQLLDGSTADVLLLFAGIEGEGSGLFLLPRSGAGISLKALQTWDGTRRFAALRLEQAAATRLDDPSRAGRLPRALALMRLYLAAEQLGGAQQCLDLTLAYTTERKQFGRVIAGFQAVKHRCAEMMVRIESLRSAVYGMAAAADGGADTASLRQEGLMLRALAAETFFFCAQEAIQLHGGVGFTWEYDPQLYFKRAQAAASWLGSADDAREAVAAALLS